jgi:hypothetical protein
MGLRGVLFIIILLGTFFIWEVFPNAVLLVLIPQVFGTLYFQFNYLKRIYTFNKEILYHLETSSSGSHSRKAKQAFITTLLLLLCMYTIPAIEIARIDLGSYTNIIAVASIIPFFIVKRIVTWLENVREDYVSSVIETLQDYKPKFAVHFDAPPASAYQLKMWLPYLERIGEDFVIILRQRNTDFPEIKKATKRPILTLPGLTLIDEITAALDSLTTVFYVNNGQRNGQIVRFGQLQHVQLLHGESDKAASFSKVTRMFDHIFVAGEAAIKRYEDNGVVVSRDQFQIVGRPQIEGVEIANGHINNNPNPTVLYAPTWTGMFSDSNYSSLHKGDEIVKHLIKAGARVIFRPHPYSYKDETSTNEIRNIQSILNDANKDRPKTDMHIFGEMAEKKWSLFECFNNSDALMSDVSSVPADYLFTEKPIAMFCSLDDEADFRQQFPLSNYTYLIKRNFSNIADQMNNLISADPMASERIAGKKYVLGDFPPSEYSSIFATKARAIVNR